jgi:release factor glutamine methyltransferase
MTKSAGPGPALAGFMTGDVVRVVTARLQTAGVDMPALEARLLICEATGLNRQALWRDGQVRLSVTAARKLEDYVTRRLAHEPVSRIIGHAEFHGLNLLINRFVLDPRSDTETLVNGVLAAAPSQDRPWRILDLGTGSGAVLCALLTHYPNAFGLGVDKSAAAAATAQTNLRRLKLNDRAAIIVGDWGTAIGSPFDIVVANPPYIESGVVPTLGVEVRDFDPHLALDGGVDGLAAYRSIGAELSALLRPNALVAFEIGASQGAAVSRIVASAGLEDIRVVRDLGGHERVVLGHLRKSLGVDRESV